jgi:alpha-mannosidase
MKRSLRSLPALLACLALSTRAAAHQDGPGHTHPDLSKDPTLYVVGYAHLDTQWRWEYPKSITEYLSKTMRDNFALFEKYPNYTFNFTGSLRYKMMREYYPEDYEKVKKYVAAGRWFAAGSSVEENDANNPSAESLIRQIHYGTHFFRREFGYTSAEFMLPDCFGFPASLPTVLAHCRIKGFVTQKLVWGSAADVGGLHSPENTPAGIPFNVGIWEGPDGSGVIGALNPGSYGATIRHDLSKNLPPAGDLLDANAPADRTAVVNRNLPVDWPKRIQRNGEVSGLYTDYHFHGTGDTGGAPREEGVKLLEAIITKGKAVLPPLVPPARGEPTPTPGPEVTVGDGPLGIRASNSDQLFLDIRDDQTGRLPRYKGDLLLTEHSAGSITSQTYVKRWNRKGELLADAAERASVAAHWLGGRPYPLDRLNRAWELVLAAQMHDIIPGTSTPKAYEYSWNDQVLALNQFAGVLTSAAESIASGLDTRAQGQAVVVYNALEIPREDVVEATLSFPSGAPQAVRVFGPEGRETPAQVLSKRDDGATRILFLAKVPSVGFAVYDVRTAAKPASRGALKIKDGTLENARYKVQVDANGDIASLYDKTVKKEMLQAPARLALQTEKPRNWPAWNMDWADREKAPRAYVQGPAQIRIVEDGPARVALEVARETEGSRFVQTIRLSAGDAGARVEIGNVIDWKTGEASLKATFPFTAANAEATYNWGIGTIRRTNNDEKKFEVPSHQWLDLTDARGSHGVTVLSDCKNGSDKPDDHTLRLTLLFTPGLGTGNGRFYNDQTSQDWGHHEFVYGLASHGGDWRQAQTDWHAYRLSQPLAAFESPKHAGALGKTFSLMTTNPGSGRVRLLALKRAEDSDEVIVRVVEADGQPARGVRLAFAAPLSGAREVDGTEEPVGPATVVRGELVADFGPYQPRTFALKLGTPPARLAPPRSQPVPLPYDRSVTTRDGRPSSGSFDADGRALAAELLPREIEYGGVTFQLAAAGDGTPNAVVARGQTVALPAGGFSRLFVLAASAAGDQKATFRVGEKAVDVTVQDWGGFIGQWDNRIWNLKQEPIQPPPGVTVPAAGPPRLRTVWEYTGLVPGYIKRAPVAWFASHHHAPDGSNEPYAYSYLFVHDLPAAPDAKTLTLPDDARLRILAVTTADAAGELRPVHPLYDTLPPAAE